MKTLVISSNTQGAGKSFLSKSISNLIELSDALNSSDGQDKVPTLIIVESIKKQSRSQIIKFVKTIRKKSKNSSIIYISLEKPNSLIRLPSSEFSLYTVAPTHKLNF